MADTKAVERRILTGAEYEAVAPTHYPDLCRHPRAELITLARRLRDYRDKAGDQARSRRRELRGKAEPRGAGPTPGENGVSRKKQVFSAALRRVNKQIARLEG